MLHGNSDARSHIVWTPTLVARLRAGGARPADLLAAFYREDMIRFCSGYLGSLDDAEDAVQDVFVKVLRATDVPDGFRPWLYRIARNHCLDMLRRRARRRDNGVLPSGSRLEAAMTGPLSRLVKGELRSKIGHLIAALPRELREVLRLRYAEGLSRAEIAEVVEITESVVKSRLYEVIKTLREHTALLDDE